MKHRYRCRRARKADEERLVELGRLHLNSAPLDLPFCENWWRKTMATVMDSTGCFSDVLLCDHEIVGFLFAVPTPSSVSPVMISRELAFYVHPDHQGRGLKPMIKAYKDWGDAHSLKLLSLTFFYEPRIVPVMERVGCLPLEATFILGQ